MDRLAALSLLAVLACAPSPEPPDTAPAWRSLVDHAAWSTVSAEADPLAAHRPEPLHCASDAWGVEADATEVRTAECDYLALSQPSAERIEAGDLVRVTIAWGRLHNAEPAEGHFALLAGDALLVDRTVPIPSPAAAHTFSWIADAPLDAGTPIVLHVHNHGANTWQLFDFARRH